MKSSWILAITLAYLACGNLCADCLDNCAQCGNGGCLSCKDSYFVNSGLTCSRCSETGCLSCSNNVCTKCDSDYQLDGSSCKATSQGRLILIIGVILIIIVVVSILFIIFWKWKAIVAFFKGHEKEVQRMKKGEEQGANWFTTVMTNNKILPKPQSDPDDSRAEINIKMNDISSTGDDHRSRNF